ncbi:MAG: DNA topoisomerase III, partial [Clostridia bacterium]|nr:DNA topoisomerase III [Clostridia bacterium]
MERIVVVAEKPSVGRDIAKVLGCTEKGDGCLIGKNHVVTWAVGHLVSLQDPDELDEKYQKWRMDDLPILPEHIPLKVLPKTRSQFSIVKKLICDKDTQRVICATDAGREGELIFRFIYNKAGCKKPIDRLWISSMTDEAIREGFAALRPGSDYEGLYQSAICRAEADWLVGMNASRAFTLRYKVLLSVGRVQTPTLALLVKRQREIDGFKPETFFTLTADFGDYKGQWFKDGQEPSDIRLPSQEAAQAIADNVKGQTGRVIFSENIPKQELPPPLYDLTTLQRDANRLLGFTAQKTLKLAQNLYETHKALTYPRTDSKCLPKDMMGRTVQALKALPMPYAALVDTALPQGKLPFSKRVFDDAKVTDHHAIIPTNKRPNLDKMSEDEKKLFDLVARRFIGAFYPPYQYDASKVITQVKEHTFRTTGRSVTQLGWKAIAPEKVKKGKASEEDAPIPLLQKGEERLVKSTSIKKDSTKPPQPHTDGSLLYAMEHAGREIEDEALREQMKGSGLGTPATRAAIIERLCQVGYAQRKGKVIQPTEKGIQLISIVPQDIASAETTGRWEQALEKIVSGEQDPQRFIEGIRRLSAHLGAYAQQNQQEASFPDEIRRGKGKKRVASAAVPQVKCPLCKEGDVLKNSRAYYCSRWKEGCGLTLWFDALQKGGGPLLTDKLIQLTTQKGMVEGSTG